MADDHKVHKIFFFIFFPLQIPRLRARHDAASGGAPLLRAPERGDEAVPDLRRAGVGRPAHRVGVRHIGEPVRGAAGRREAAVALPRVRGQERGAAHARGAGCGAEAGHGGGLQDLRQGLPFLAGRQGRRSPSGDSAGHDGSH